MNINQINQIISITYILTFNVFKSLTIIHSKIYNHFNHSNPYIRNVKNQASRYVLIFSRGITVLAVVCGGSRPMVAPLLYPL